MEPSPSPGRLTVITGPSGVGKGTLVALLLERHPDIWLSVSATTRAPRPGEVEGKHYFFKTRQSFERQVAEGGFLEWAEFAGNLYGTPRAEVESHLEAGRPVLLEIELEGARQVRRSFPSAFQLLLKPPSLAGTGAAHPQPSHRQRSGHRRSPGAGAGGTASGGGV